MKGLEKIELLTRKNKYASIYNLSKHPLHDTELHEIVYTINYYT